MDAAVLIYDMWDVILALIFAIAISGYAYRLWKYAESQSASAWVDFSVDMIVMGIYLSLAEIAIVIRYMAHYAGDETLAAGYTVLSNMLWLAAAYYGSKAIKNYLNVQREVLG